MQRLNREFFARQTDAVALDLIGCRLSRVLPDGKILSGLISETEAYIGINDMACHTSRGKTKRNEVMFGPPGHFYVYLTYGIHYMFNIVSGPKESASAVLIRALIPETGLEIMTQNRKGKADLTGGPAKLTQALGINRDFNGVDMIGSSELFITTGIVCKRDQIDARPRIGINYAGERDRNALLRFVLIS